MAKQKKKNSDNLGELLIELFFDIGLLFLKNLLEGNPNNISNPVAALGKLISNIFSSLFNPGENTSEIKDNSNLFTQPQSAPETTEVSASNLPSIPSSSLGGTIDSLTQPVNQPVMDAEPFIKPAKYWHDMVVAQRSAAALEPSMQID